MGIKRFLAAFAAGALLMPMVASAQITLSAQGQQQLNTLTLQLLGIVSGLTNAQSQGSAYLSSPVFQAQADAWTKQIAQISQQLVTLLTIGSQTTPTILPTLGGNSSTCPSLSRDLSIGAQGGDVAQLQLFLSRDPYGKYLSGVNGYFDQATQDAIERYQSGYGIVSGGSPSTTGYGRVGPGTRASIAAICARGTYVTSVPPITIPATGGGTVSPTPAPTPAPTPPATPIVGYSTGQLSVVPNSLGNSGGPTSIQFSINLLPNSACSAAAYTLAFGDGQSQSITSNASCGNQIKILTHVYAQVGQYTVTLSSGSFSTNLVVNVQAPNNNLSLSVKRDASTALLGHITATYDPGATCAAGSYVLAFGDGQSQALAFNASGCVTQVQIIDHTFPNTTPYLITASDSAGHTVAVSFTPVSP